MNDIILLQRSTRRVQEASMLSGFYNMQAKRSERQFFDIVNFLLCRFSVAPPRTLRSAGSRS